MAHNIRAWTVREPITDKLTNPDTKPPRKKTSPRLSVWGASNQYEPASFVLHSRRGVDGVRYVTTLKDMIDAGEGARDKRAAAKKFLKDLSPDGDLAAQRKRCARQILALAR